MTAVTYLVQWPTFLLEDFQVVLTSLALVYYDNKYALHLAANPTFYEHIKHIELDCHIVKEKSKVVSFTFYPFYPNLRWQTYAQKVHLPNLSSILTPT